MSDIRVTDSTGAEKQGSPITGASMPSGGKGVIGWLSAIWKRLTDGLTVSPPAVLTASGEIDADAETVTLSGLDGYETVTMHISGTYSGTLSFLFSPDGGSTTTQGFTTGFQTSFTSSTGITHQFKISGYNWIRVTGSSWVSGGATVALYGYPSKTDYSYLNAVYTAIMADWDSNDRCKTSPISGQDGVAGGSGTVGSTTQRVTIATNDAAVTSLGLLDDAVATTASAIPTKGFAIAGTDGTLARILKTDTGGIIALPTLPAGTNNIGDVDVLTLPALPAGTNNIGDVDVLTLPALPAGTNNIGDVDVLTVPADPFGVNADDASPTGSISAKLRYMIATGIPITGTVTVDTELPAAAALADAASLPTAPKVGACSMVYNGSTLDLERGNVSVTALASAARTSTTYSSDITVYNGQTLILTWDVTANPSAGSVKCRIQAKDELSGKYSYIHADWGNITSAQTVNFALGPGVSSLVGNVNQVTSLPLPRVIRVEVIHGGGSSITYSVGLTIGKA